MSDNKLSSRLSFVYDQFTKQYEKSIKKDKLINHRENSDVMLIIGDASKTKNLFTEDIPENYVDVSFLSFVNRMGINIKSLGNTFKDALFNYFLKFDPSPNKEYMQWYINLYGDLCRNRPQITKQNKTNEQFSEKTVSAENLFFEDLGKIAEAIEVFIFLKKTSVLSNQQRDINQYKTYNEFINTIKPYAALGDDDSEQVHTLTHSEIKCIQNFVNAPVKTDKVFSETEEPIAELVYEDDTWVIVQTHNKEANAIFGKNTSWCTAGTRYMSMFSSYHDQGPLLVLIKKGYGSVYHIRNKPNVRLQFHFESSQYMDARDTPIKINLFLKNYPKVKSFFSKYVDAAAFKLLQTGKPEQVINFLKTLGYGDELISVLKRVQPESIELDDFKLSPKALNEIGDIVSLKKLILIGCDIDNIPESFTKLKKLRHLQICDNDKLTVVPDYINELTSLIELDLSNCNILNNFDISGLVNLEHLILDDNNKLKSLPTIGNINKLYRITASNCDIKEIPDYLMSLKDLYMIDVHFNKNLKKVPEYLTKLEDLVACNFVGTNIPEDVVQQLITQAESKPQKCAVAYF